MNLNEYMDKYAAIEYKPHQKRAVEKLDNQRGVLVYHGLGSGKTLTSILAGEQHGGATVVVPASLRGNYSKELAKADAKQKYDVDSYEMFIKSEKPIKPLLVLDEAHRIRTSGTKRSQKVRESAKGADKVMLLTGTPIQNKPHEIAPLINTLTGTNTLPLSEGDFNRMFIEKIKHEPGFFKGLFGARSTTTRGIKNSSRFARSTKGLVDYHASSTEDFPSKREHQVSVPFSPDQLKSYRLLERKAGAAVRHFVQNKLPADKQSSKNLNAFASGVRQVANTERMFTTNETSESPKIKAVVDKIKASNGPVLVYSNYLDSGVFPVKDSLDKAGITNEVYTGKINKKEKDRIVNAYNNGDVKALLVSSSGGEGLDLKNTRQVHIIEPHWNDAKIEQVIGRAARYKSHETLPEEEKNVDVFKYVSTLPNKKSFGDKVFGKEGKHQVGIDQYLYQMSAMKKELNDKFLDILKNS
jgi:superfamily II DNA or RNA helicase